MSPFFSSTPSGTRAEKHICPQEETQLSSPKLEPVIKSGDYEELVWTVKDPNKPEAKQHLVHCSKDLICTSYTQIGDFETRIKIGTPVRGMLNVTLTLSLSTFPDVIICIKKSLSTLHKHKNIFDNPIIRGFPGC